MTVSKPHLHPAFLLAAGMMLSTGFGGCTAGRAAQEARAIPHPAAAPPVAEPPAAAIARLLAEADAAQGDPRALGRAIAMLDAYGARPLDPGADPVAAWRSTAHMPQTPPYRGRLLGPAYKAGQLPPGASVRLPQLFNGGRIARVAVATPGQAAIEFAVLDAEARPVCPPARARNPECTWTPLYSGRFEIVLSNSSASAAGYYLVID
ncbi:MAG: hypothetical protein ACK4Z7_05345 [Novosphingobium sp.]